MGTTNPVLRLHRLIDNEPDSTRFNDAEGFNVENNSNGPTIHKSINVTSVQPILHFIKGNIVLPIGL